MLKKIAHITLILLMVVATTGFTINKHYCGKHLVSVSYVKMGRCTCGDKDCHTEIKLMKVTDNYSASELIHTGNPTSFYLPVVIYVETTALVGVALTSAYFFIKAPPNSSKNPFALLQTFRC